MMMITLWMWDKYSLMMMIGLFKQGVDFNKIKDEAYEFLSNIG